MGLPKEVINVSLNEVIVVGPRSHRTGVLEKGRDTDPFSLCEERKVI